MTDNPASAWPEDLLNAIATSDDLHVAPFREDRRTYGTPTWIWSVVVDGALYARAWHGRRSRWFQAALTQHAGRITAAGAEHDVRFEQADPSVNARVDAAYERKYAGSPYLPPMLQDGPTSATVQILPTTR
ncbi:DUF2255 family protein [Curtobacterium sp. MCBA15_001]|uniref:DUF2255 family protein n=1 Tax=Curtobacterium sp. MCBA15_001 TaxID=1898731 RepID=UPI0008DCE238|nr:DUF2255 family protein [Curtobacterium sp. MCBA15_001]OIH92425.1 hypothetical protein BIU90_11075 [Curtobacterium sp. MCBA15_001]